jgi:exosortase
VTEHLARMRRAWRALVLVPVAAVFAPTLWHLMDAGRTNEYAGHAMFVPLFSVLAAWTDRDRLRAAAGRGHPAGLAILALGLALLGARHAMQSEVLGGVALAAAVAGAVLWLFGARCLRAAAFPVAFLIMMAPLPRPVIAAVTLQLQAFAAGFAASALRLVGLPVYQTGVYLELPAMTLQVAEACNGLRFLLALIVLTAAFAQVMLSSWQRKMVLVAAAAPIAILANAVRVAVIGVGVHYVGPEAASGTVHNLIGKGVWAITLIPLIALGFWLARSAPRRGAGGSQPAAVPADGTGVA